MTETPPKPIWTKQPKESSNAYCWFQEFLNYPTYEIQRFHEHITKNQKEIIKKNGKKVKIPTLKTMYTWSTNHTWRKRKEAFLENEANERTLYLRQLRLKHSREELDLLHEIKMTQLKNIRDQIRTGQKSGYDFNQNMQGIKVINDMDLLELGEPTENIKQNLTADVTQKSTSNDELLVKIQKMKEERSDALEDDKE